MIKNKAKLSVLFTLTILLLSSTSWAATYYASPTGGGNGQSKSSPFKIKNFWSVAKPGDTLYLLNGTYTGDASMVQPPSNVDGVQGKPITIAGLNEGKAIIDGQGSRTPVMLHQNDWMILEGFNVCNAGRANNGKVLRLLDCNHNIVRRMCGWNGHPKENSTIFHAADGSYNLFEDNAGWGPARKIFSQHQEDHTTFRRNFFRWTWVDKPYAMGMTFSYRCTNSLLENNIGTWDEQGMPPLPSTTFRNGIYGVDATDGNGGYRMFGNIAYNLKGQVGPPRKAFNYSSRHSNTNYVLKDAIAYSENPKVGNFKLKDMTFTASNLTSIGSGDPAGLEANINKVTDSIVMGSNTYGITNGGFANYVMVHANQKGNFQQNPSANYSAQDPKLIAKAGNILQYGLSEADRPKVGGRSVGAKIEYRYVNGKLTDTPLWPWPMNDRIKEAMIQSGYDKIGGLDGKGGIDLTKTVFELGGGTMPSDFDNAYTIDPPRNVQIVTY